MTTEAKKSIEYLKAQRMPGYAAESEPATEPTEPVEPTEPSEPTE